MVSVDHGCGAHSNVPTEDRAEELPAPVWETIEWDAPISCSTEPAVADRQPAHLSEIQEVRQVVAAFVAAGADESVQRVITAVHRLSRRLNRWYDRQFAALGITTGEWTVLERLARSPDEAPLTPGELAEAANVAPSSMTHRLDRMVERGLIERVGRPGQPGTRPGPADRRRLRAVRAGHPRGRPGRGGPAGGADRRGRCNPGRAAGGRNRLHRHSEPPAVAGGRQRGVLSTCN